MKAILCSLADVECDLIRIRTAEGRARSGALGIRIGRPPKLSEEQKLDIRRRRPAGEFLRRLAEDYCVSIRPVSRVAACLRGLPEKGGQVRSAWRVSGCVADGAEEIHYQVIRGAEDRVRMMAGFASGEAER